MNTRDSATPPTAPLILLVDDEPAVLYWLSQPLLEAGFRVITAPNGMKAIDTVRRERPDFALIDMMMPRMDGFEVVKLLKEDPVTAETPVGIMQGFPADYPMFPYRAISGRGEVYQSDQVELVVTKPLLKDPAELVDTLRDWFSHHT